MVLKPYVRPGIEAEEPQELPDSSRMLRIALFWRDAVAHKTIEERKGFTHEYMQAHFLGDVVSQTEIDAICEAANLFYERVHLPYRMRNLAGEFLPYLDN